MRGVRPTTAVTVLGLTLGLTFAFLTPPFQAPDEYNHYFRAYQISEGTLLAKRSAEIDPVFRTERVGGAIPASLVIATFRVSQDLPFKPENKQKVGDIFALVRQPLRPQERYFAHFPNTALYAPVSYLPQALGMAVGRWSGLSPLVLLYLGRLADLLAWLVLVRLAVASTPVQAWVFALVALTPMSLFQAASVSADAVLNGLAMLFVGVILRVSLGGQVSTAHLVALVVLPALIALSKQAYAGLCLLFLVIPAGRFSSPGRYWGLWGTTVAVTSGAVLAWTSLTRGLYVPMNPLVPLESQSPERQLTFVVHHPIQYAQIILDTLRVEGLRYAEQFVGVLGWLDTRLPHWLVVSYAAILVATALASGRPGIGLSWRQRSVIALVLAVNLLAAMTLVYMAWTPMADRLVAGVQGRYFIPLAPLAFLLLYNQRLRLRVPAGGWLLCLYVLLSGGTALWRLIERFYL